MDDLVRILQGIDARKVRKNPDYLLGQLDLVVLFAHELGDDRAAEGLRDLIRGVKWRLEGDKKQL